MASPLLAGGLLETNKPCKTLIRCDIGTSVGEEIRLYRKLPGHSGINDRSESVRDII